MIDAIYDWIDFGPGKWVLGGFLLFGVIALAYAMIEEERIWQEFKVDHQCRIVGKTEGHTAIGSGVDGKGNAVVMTHFISGQTGWFCDDGVTYWRNN